MMESRTELASYRRKLAMRRQLRVCKLYDDFLNQSNPQCNRADNGKPGNDSIVFDLLGKRALNYWSRNINYG